MLLWKFGLFRDGELGSFAYSPGLGVVLSLQKPFNEHIYVELLQSFYWDRSKWLLFHSCGYQL